ncbi:MAG TPA: TlpA disulfide reductase family protein [Aggregatilinea sp.]|uniref:TlpA disulfide reductase family protein n=1 Tax=Aggregatilinea sp. TaxID=2806333 RepID=UPI002BDEE436|nr:TlpA disulfide reductase family protein [Aggregatilinea sp.]HML24217.1 TlpA disulfide reductase family protein [Aggregatilinea sp.]
MASKRTSRASRRHRREISPWMILVGSALVIVGGLLVMTLTRKDAPATASSRPVPTLAGAQPAAVTLSTDFKLPGLDGNVALADYRGSYVLVNFWATWCPPCRAEMPDLDAYQQANVDSGFTVLAVNVGEDRATVQGFIDANGFSFPVALDVNSAVFAQYRRESLPSSFLIGPDGSVVKAWEPGALSRATLERDITPLLAG